MRRAVSPLLVLSVVAAASCANKTSHDESTGLGPAGAAGDAGSTFDVGASGGGLDAAVDGAAPPANQPDPTTCAEAASRKTYVGCDYWPTVVANNVWSVFDFAAVVANAGDAPAEITVTGPGGVSQTVTVPPNGLKKIYLPWVAALKGSDFAECAPVPLPGSVFARKSAYHLIASVPVSVYQFNALEYKGSGGPPGKSWAECPPAGYCKAGKLDCYSFSNDASLLLPSTAMTGNYRVTGMSGWTDETAHAVTNSYFAITATADGTHVKVKVGSKGKVLAGTGIAATAAGDTLELDLDAGDVVELACEPGAQCDPSGSLVQATRPVQVIAGNPCTNVPNKVATCDHLESTVFPAETLGQRYLVTVPTGPHATLVGHVVRFYGNVDGTHLTYPAGRPGGAPSTLDAGQVVEALANQDFEVTGDAAFAVGSFMIGSANLDPSVAPPNQKGDPSQSNYAAVEQYRSKYVFLTPDDYDVAFLDMVVPTGVTVALDGAPATTVWDQPISGGMRGVRVKLEHEAQGAHVLTASAPFGLQVIGYGSYTSYMYPGGLNLSAIAPPPIK